MAIRKCAICFRENESCKGELICVLKDMQLEEYNVLKKWLSRKHLMTLLEQEDPENRRLLFLSLLGEARKREEDPIGGCYEALQLREKELDAVTKIFLWKSKADFSDDLSRRLLYRMAMDYATANLPPIHRVRLQLAFDFCHVLYRENSRDQCRAIARKVFDAALPYMGNADEESAGLIQQLDGKFC